MPLGFGPLSYKAAAQYPAVEAAVPVAASVPAAHKIMRITNFVRPGYLRLGKVNVVLPKKTES